MTLNEFIKRLQALADRGYGDLPMYATHGASGATDRIGNPRVTEVFDTVETGDLIDLPVGTRYIDVYIGN